MTPATTPAIDWSDPSKLVLRDGRRVLEVLKTDVKDRDYPVVAVVEEMRPLRAAPFDAHAPEETPMAGDGEAVYLYAPCGAYSAPGRTHSYDVIARKD